MDPANRYSVEYDYKTNQLNVLKENNKIGELKAEDLNVDAQNLYYMFARNRSFYDKDYQEYNKPEARDFRNRLSLLPEPIKLSTSDKISNLKVKEKRLRFVKQHPFANGVLNVVSSIGIGLLAIPWGICYVLFGAPSLKYPDISPGDLKPATSKSEKGFPQVYSPETNLRQATQNTLCRIGPIFSSKKLSDSIEKDKKELADLVGGLHDKLNDEYFEKLNEIHAKDITLFGIEGWNQNMYARQNYRDMLQIQKIAKDVFGKEFAIKDVAVEAKLE